MAVYRCNPCGFVCEDAIHPVGSKTSCGRCGSPCTVYGTVFFIEKLVERYAAALREVASLQRADEPSIDSEASVSTSATGSDLKQAFADADPYNTTLLATADQHAPLQAWFQQNKINAQFDHALVDTTGFFDDAAHMLGDGWSLYAELLDRVRYAYRKAHSTIHLELGELSQKDASSIQTLCRQFYSHTLFARYHYQKQEKVVRLTLQTAPTVRQFFDGGWLEWYVFIEAVQLLRSVNQRFSCARGAKVVFPNEDLHELDIVFLSEGHKPVCIECKSGEFRRDIDKYVKLRKRLGLSRERFIICAADLGDEQAKGLSAMYELTFVNLNSLRSHMQKLV